MQKTLMMLIGTLVLFIPPTAVQAVPTIDIFQFAAFINSPDIGPNSLEDTRIDPFGIGFNEFEDAGLEVVFENDLKTDNLGTVTWKITNTTGKDLSMAKFFGFLDAEILDTDDPDNTFFDEFGAFVSLPGKGSNDPAPDSWEIDEPGFVFGDIFDNLLNGSLDNTNSIPKESDPTGDGIPGDDVSLALGFEIGTFSMGDSIIATFQINKQDIGGLSQTDPKTNTTFFFNSSATMQRPPLPPIKVPEPTSLWLLLIGLITIHIGYRRKSRHMSRYKSGY